MTSSQPPHPAPDPDPGSAPDPAPAILQDQLPQWYAPLPRALPEDITDDVSEETGAQGAAQGGAQGGTANAVPVRASTLKAWPNGPKPGAWAALHFCPIVLSELHVLAQHLPIVVIEGDEGPEIVLDLQRQTLVRSPLNADGLWELHYTPLALRLLPFHATSAGQQMRLTGLQMTAELPRSEVEQKKLKTLLAQYAQDRKRLSKMAQILRDAGYLIPPPTRAPTADGLPLPEYQLNIKMAAQNDAIAGGAVIFRLFVLLMFSQKNRVISPDATGFPFLNEATAKQDSTLGLDLGDFLKSDNQIIFD